MDPAHPSITLVLAQGATDSASESLIPDRADPPAEPDRPGGLDTLSTGLFVVGVLIILMILMSRLRHRSSAVQQMETPARQRIQQLREQASAVRSTDQVMADAHELTRRLAAHLDNKAARIETLLEQADRRIAELERVLASAAAPPSPVGRSGSLFGTDDDLLRDPINREVLRLADEGRSPVEIAQRLDQQIGKVELILALRRA